MPIHRHNMAQTSSHLEKLVFACVTVVTASISLTLEQTCFSGISPVQQQQHLMTKISAVQSGRMLI